jgi:hypothetical protein
MRPQAKSNWLHWNNPRDAPVLFRFPDVFCKREIFTVKFEQIDTNNIGPSAQHFDKVAVGFIEKHEPAFKQMWPEPCAQGKSSCDNRGDCQEPRELDSGSSTALSSVGPR